MRNGTAAVGADGFLDGSRALHRDTSGELLTFAQAAARLNLGVLDIRRMVRAEQIPMVLDGRGRRRIPAAWCDDPRSWLR